MSIFVAQIMLIKNVYTNQNRQNNPMKKLKNRKKNGDQHVWQFSRVGGINRVNLYSGNDLLALEHLDQKLWTA